jgi:hypothetical protein
MQYTQQRSAVNALNQPRQATNHCGNDNISAVSLNQSQRKNTGRDMTQEVEKNKELSVIEQVVMQGDLSKLNPEQRVLYYRKVCESAGLNPFTRPFDYLSLNGKLTLYAKKDCTEQLRKLNGISIESLEDKIVGDIYIVKARAKTKDGRTDEATGAVTIGHLKGDAKANAMMKAETKAKRRVTLSISGMGWTDETEIDSIPNAKTIDVDLATGEIKKPIQPIEVKVDPIIEKPKINEHQVIDLDMILSECEENYKTWFYECLYKQYNTQNLSDLPLEVYEKAKSGAIRNMESYHLKQKQVHEESNVLQEIQ